MPKAKSLRLKSSIGSNVDIDLTKAAKTIAQRKAIEKLIRSKKVTALTTEERELIEKLKIRIKPPRGGGNALIVRFDWTWIRIDERSNLPRLKKKPTKKKAKKKKVTKKVTKKKTKKKVSKRKITKKVTKKKTKKKSTKKR